MRNAFNVCIIYHALYYLHILVARRDSSSKMDLSQDTAYLLQYTRQSKFNFTLNTTSKQTVARSISLLTNPHSVTVNLINSSNENISGTTFSKLIILVAIIMDTLLKN